MRIKEPRSSNEIMPLYFTVQNSLVINMHINSKFQVSFDEEVKEQNFQVAKRLD